MQKRLDQALELIRGAASTLMNPNYSQEVKATFAKTFYRESIDAYETAEAITHLEKAIALDPTLGNPLQRLGARVQSPRQDGASTCTTRQSQASATV